MTSHRTISPVTEWILKCVGNLLTHRSVHGGRIFIINYHRVLATHNPLLSSEPDLATFRWQMELLARCFNVMPLNEALEAIKAGRVPPRAVCITFDDGYRSIHDLALPVLREFGLRATVFVTSGHVDKGNMWNDHIIQAIQSLPSGELDLSVLGLGKFSLNTLADRKATIGTLTEQSKYLPPSERRKVIEHLRLAAGQELSPDLMLTRDMVSNLDRHGIEIGAHTVSHPILTSLDDDSARAEIYDGKQELESILGKRVRYFAYPNGKSEKDFDHRHVAMVREAGFDAAFTTAVGAITRERDWFQLPRSRPWDDTPLAFGMRLLLWMAQGNPR